MTTSPTKRYISLVLVHEDGSGLADELILAAISFRIDVTAEVFQHSPDDADAISRVAIGADGRAGGTGPGGRSVERERTILARSLNVLTLSHAYALHITPC